MKKEVKNATMMPRLTKFMFVVGFLLTTIMSYANNLAYAQNQTFTFHLKNVSIKTVLQTIEKQSEFIFMYRSDLLDTSKKVSVDADKKSVSQILDQILEGTAVTYEINDRQIVLKKAKTINLQQSNSQQTKKVYGVVKDEAGETVIGANVWVKGTTTGVVTDIDGRYQITLNDPKAILVFSYLGMKTQEVAVGNKLEINIVLVPDAERLDEVVVVGYGTQRKGNIATAVTTIKSEILQNRPVQTISEALQGQVPGLSVTGSAAPGSSPSLQLRGSSVLNTNNSSAPLILVDGVPADFNFLNPEDIESINVLKDAASSAIYGSRAANGVLLITTKRGKEGQPKFCYNGSIGVNTPMHMPEMLGSADYARIRNEAEENVGRAPIYSEEDIAKFVDGSDPNRYPNVNWLDLVLQNSLITRHNIEASGGTDKVRYLISSGMNHQTGLLPRMQQNVFNVRSSTDISINSKFDISFDIRYQLRDFCGIGDHVDVYKQVLASTPTMVAYYTDGTYGYNSQYPTNVLVSLYEKGEVLKKRHEASGIFKLNYELLKGLKLTAIANVKYTFTNQDSRERKFFYTDYFTQDVIESGQNSFSDRRDYNAYYNLQVLLNYKKKIKNHSLDLLAGYQQENESSDWLEGARSGYPTDIIWELNPGPKDNWSNDGNGQHWALASFIGRINYDYDNKYILSLSMRSDASSRFAKGSRWASFPSIAAAWRVSQESFMNNTRDFLDDLKLRFSWGQTGNANGLGLYPSYTLVSTGGIILNNSYQQIAQLKTIGNENLSWERSEMFNVGIDARFFGGHLNFTGEYYVKNTKDILLALPVPLEYGFGNPNMNIGKVRNKGWEISLGWNDEIHDFSYSVSANLSDNRNEVVDLGNTGPWKGSDTYTEVGLPFNSIYGYESMGLFQSDQDVNDAPFQNSKTRAGDIRYKDQNGDNKIDANDRVVLGDRNPHYLYGLNFSFAYKNFDLGMFFQGIGCHDRIVKDSFVRPFYDSSISKHQLDYWTPQNTDARYPRILYKDDGSHNYEVSDFWMINAGYLRMKNISLGYTLPKKIISFVGLGSARIYFTANNLFTISGFVPGMDPEASSAWAYPFARTYSFGLNVQF